VRRGAPDHRPERDDRVDGSIAVGEGQCHQRDLEGTRHPADGDIGAIDAGVTEDVENAFEKPRRDRAVETATDDSYANAPPGGRPFEMLTDAFTQILDPTGIQLRLVT
jgi:hypothetical protein